MRTETSAACVASARSKALRNAQRERKMPGWHYSERAARREETRSLREEGKPAGSILLNRSRSIGDQIVSEALAAKGSSRCNLDT